MTPNQQIEQEIIAPRVTPDSIESKISAEYCFTADKAIAGCPQVDGLGLLTFCVLVLENGFMVTGESACASPENFDAEIGRKIARQNAIAKIWPLEGYVLRNKLSKIDDFPSIDYSHVKTDAEALDDLNS